MSERDDLILNHIARYRVSLRAVIERLFFEGRSCDHVIQRLLEQSRLVSIPIPGNLSAYQLTLPEGRARGFEYRGRNKATTLTLRRDIASLWFCCMHGYRRKRLTERETRDLLDAAPEKRFIVPHVLHREEDTTVYRLYTPDISAAPDDLAERIKDHALGLHDSPFLMNWAERGTYQYAILTETTMMRDFLQRRLSAEEPYLPVKLHYELVPPYDGIADAIRALKDEDHAS